MYPGRHLLGRVPFEDGDARLQDHRAAVELFGDEVDAGAVFVVTGVDGALVGVQPLVLGQQGGVDVDHPPGKVPHQVGTQDPHKPGQHHQVGLIVVHQRQQGGVILLPTGKLLLGEDGGGHPRLFGTYQTIGIGLVADDADHLTGNLAIGTTVENGLQVAAVAGDKDQDAFHGGGHLAVDPVIHWMMTCSSPSAALAIWPICQAFSPSALSRVSAFSS